MTPEGLVPEGDSIRRVAQALAPLTGQVIERMLTQGLVRDLAGRTVVSVTPYGKHLTIDLDDGTQLRTHLGMNGRVRRYPRAEGEATIARLSAGRASLVIVTRDLVALWIGARTVEVSARRAPMRGLAVASLGPDVLAEGFDPELAAARAASYPDRPVGVVLLDQRVAAGIGNIWKSEALHACGVDPRTPVGALSRDALAGVYRRASELMHANLATSPPRGVRAGFAVYSRTGQPCLRCATAIDVYRLGDPPRWTWSCARCQPRS